MNELNRLETQAFKQAEKFPVVFVLDSIRSMANIGSIFRTADGFAFQKMYLCGITAKPPHREISKTALGAELSMDWEYVASISECITKLKQDGFEIYALEQVENSVSLEKFSISSSKKYAIILGNEVDGVSQEALSLCNGALEIPQFGTKHSLNVGVCAGIIGWDFLSKLLLKNDFSGSEENK